MGQTLYIDYEKQSVDQALVEKSPETALRLMIAQQTSGQTSKELLHSVVRAVMPRNDNALKRLLYYYLETMADDKSLVVCMNQISKDLSSPNEYVRGLVLRFISRLENSDYVSLLLKGVRDNLSNKSAYVRMNAISCLSEIVERFEIDAEDELHAVAQRESSPEVLRVVFDVMHRLGMGVDNYLKTTYPDSVLETLVEKTDDPAFLLSLLHSKHPGVLFKLSNKLLRMNMKEAGFGCVDRKTAGSDGRTGPEHEISVEAVKGACVDNILRILETNPSLKYDFIPSLGLITGHCIELLGLLDPYEPEFSRSLISRAFENAETHEFIKVAETLYSRYAETGSSSEKKRQFKILLLESMASFTASHCVYAGDMVSICMSNITTDDTEMVYASLKFLSSVVNQCVPKLKQAAAGGEADGSSDRGVLTRIVAHLISTFSAVQHGKILRFVFDIISTGISRDQFEALLDALLDNFSRSVPYLLNNEVFAGTHICISIASMHREEWDCKPKTIGTLIRFLQYGSQSDTIDVSSRSTIASCIRAVMGGRTVLSSSDDSAVAFCKTDTLEPIRFLLLNCVSPQARFEWENPLDNSTDTVQLSGLGDPLYIEANVSFSKYELAMDLLIINQTDSYLQDINLDFISSKYVTRASKNTVISLQSNSASTMKVLFSIKESSSCFVSASASFKFPKKQEYASAFVQNLNDVSIDISRFLEGANIDFKGHWKDLEWENIYSLTLRKTDPGLLLGRIAAATNGFICDKTGSFNFLVANIACYTSQHSLVLVNICFSTEDSTVAEIRVRAKDEEIVKSVSTLLSQCLKCI